MGIHPNYAPTTYRGYNLGYSRYPQYLGEYNKYLLYMLWFVHIAVNSIVDVPTTLHVSCICR